MNHQVFTREWHGPSQGVNGCEQWWTKNINRTLRHLYNLCIGYTYSHRSKALSVAKIFTSLSGMIQESISRSVFQYATELIMYTHWSVYDLFYVDSMMLSNIM